MILLVDVGNTLAKWAFWDGGEVRLAGSCPTGDWAGLDLGDKPVRLTVAACVAGERVAANLTETLAARGISIHWLRPAASSHGVVNEYTPPESLGVDRYAALVGARRRFGMACLVVGVGTALTADVLTSEGHFPGGCIVPGPALMRAALKAGTAGVAPLEGGWRHFPSSTATAVDSGITLALLGVVDTLRRRLAEREGGPLPPVVLHGGARDWILPHLEGDVRDVETLVLEGLAWIARDLGYAD